MTRADDYVKAHAIFAAWKFASHFGGVNNMIGVLWVIKNRSDAGWGSYLQVLDTMHKHEAAPPVTTTHPDPWERRFVSLLGQVDGIFDHTANDITNSALWFADTTNITNDEFLTRVARNPQKMRCANTASWTYWSNLEGQEVLQPVNIA